MRPGTASRTGKHRSHLVRLVHRLLGCQRLGVLTSSCWPQARTVSFFPTETRPRLGA